MAGNYTVESKEEIRKLSPGGEIETWFRVWATTKKGTYFHMDIPEKDVGTDEETTLLSARAQAIDKH